MFTIRRLFHRENLLIKTLHSLLISKKWIFFLMLWGNIAVASSAFGVCLSDINGDGSVDMDDLSIAAEQYGRSGCGITATCDADLDQDNDVDAMDVRRFVLEYGSTSCVPQTVVGGLISEDTTWTIEGSPYIVTTSITIQGTDGADGITTLTIEPGVTVKFGANTNLAVGAADGAPGALAARGTAANPITLTSNQATPAPGDWLGIRVLNTADDATTIVEHCSVDYAGYSYGALYSLYSYPTFRNVAVRHSRTYGAYIYRGSGPTFENCTFSQNQDYDLYYNSTTGGGSVTGTTITNGIYQSYSGAVHFSGNIIYQNNEYPIIANVNNIGGISTSTFHNVDADSYLQVDTLYLVLNRDSTWGASIPIYVQRTVTVQGTDGADGITTLTVSPGATIKFENQQSLLIGGISGDPGALIAQGTAENMITFTSNDPYPYPGIWTGVTFNNTADDATSIVKHAIVEYAGGSGHGAVRLTNAKPTLSHSIFRKSAWSGVYLEGSGSVGNEIRCNNFVHNRDGVYCSNDSLPLIRDNNFIQQSGYGVKNTTANTVDAENNWWGDPQGSNTGGDRTYGDVDADPWSTEENDCIVSGENHPPNTPAAPVPADNAVRVALSSGSVTLKWAGGDPDTIDTVTYDLKWGTSADTLETAAQNITGHRRQMTDLSAGLTYYWQITARDNHGAETAGPVWRFTVRGDQPDLTISQVATDPPGHLQQGQSVTFNVTVQNIGSGPAVDPFQVDCKIDGVSIGTSTIDAVISAGSSLVASITWPYNGGDPTIDVTADSQQEVSETNEDNNQYSAKLSQVADITAPALTGTSPADGAYLQHVQQVTATLADSQASVDDAAVIASFTVRNATQTPVGGSVVEAGDTFTFTPDTGPLADGQYQVSLDALDSYGNAQSYIFTFTVDSQPPAKPVITGGSVSSGTIQPRPVQNTADQFIAELTGTREAGTAVLINGIERTPVADSPWSVALDLQLGDNAFEVKLKDRAGNIGPSEWVDIRTQTGDAVHFDYDPAGRVESIYSNP
jgi:hypothetical protein